MKLRRQAVSATAGLHPSRVGRSLVAVTDRASAAAKYSPARVVPTFCVSALFVKPSASVSGSNCNAGLLVSLRSARTVLLYSTRDKRRSGARPVTSCKGIPPSPPPSPLEDALASAPGPLGAAPGPPIGDPALGPVPATGPTAPVHATVASIMYDAVSRRAKPASGRGPVIRIRIPIRSLSVPVLREP